MSAWQLFPNHVWLDGRDHTVVLLVMRLPERRVLAPPSCRNRQARPR